MDKRMNYYGIPEAGDRSGLYPGQNYPGARFGVPQQPGLNPEYPQHTSVQSLVSRSVTQSYTAFPGMAPRQSLYTAQAYNMPQSYPGMMQGASGLSGMGGFYSMSNAAPMPYSTLQPIPQATPSIPSVASLPSVPAMPQIPSIQATQGGYPANQQQFQLSQAYMSNSPSTQPGYPIGTNPLLTGSMSPAGMPGSPYSTYPSGSAIPPVGYPSHAMTNTYPGISGIRMSPQAGQPYRQGF